ncbi:MAG: diphthine--ammonia ligase [Candidatus Woesearchaeota archaeon]
MKLAALFTGGKDSTYAIYLAKKQSHKISCLITIQSENLYSYMFHTPAIELAVLQAEAMGLPIVFGETKGEKEKELEDLEKAIKKAQEQFEFAGIITGALFSEYQSSRIQKICQKLGLEYVSPLWHKEQAELMEELIENKFELILTGIAAEGLDKSWLNKTITKKEIDQLKELNKNLGINCAGEGGEFESLVLDCPLFKKKLVIEDFEISEENKNTARMIIKKAKLVEK